MYRRFTQFLNIRERYCYALISHAIFNSLLIKSLTFLEVCIDKKKMLSNVSCNKNIVFLGFLKSVTNLEIWNFRTIHNSWFAVAIEIINLSNMLISNEIFLSMLSPMVQILTLNSVTFSSPITFKDIVSRIPNIQKITFYEVKLGNNWPNLLVENCQKLTSFSSTANEDEIDGEKICKCLEYYYGKNVSLK